jgi:hypothetical protein
MDNRFTHWWDSSRLFLSLTYNFGRSKYQAKKLRKQKKKTEPDKRKPAFQAGFLVDYGHWHLSHVHI